MNTLSSIQWSFTEAKKSPFYSRYYSKYSLPNSIEEFQNLPFVNSEDLKENNNAFLASSQESIEKIVTIKTSGTTSKAKRIFFSKSDLNSTISFFSKGLASIIGKRDNTLVMMPYKLKYSVGDLIIESIKKIGANPIPIGFLIDFERTFELLKKANSIVGTPIQLLSLSRYAKYRGLKLKLKGILLSSDLGSKEVYDEISKNFNCKVLNHYGTTEICFGGAVECSNQEGMHIRNEDLYFEIIDKDSLDLLPNGEWGEIVVTTLSRNTMPLIRYRTGDYGRLFYSNCKCGKKELVLDRVKGRISEIFRKNKHSIYELDNFFFSFLQTIDYEATIKNNALNIKVYLLPGADLEKLEQNFKKKFGDKNTSIEIIYTEIWPNLYEGKRKIKIDD